MKNFDVQLINEELLSELRAKAKDCERKRQNFDLRTTPNDTSQRMLNVLEVGTMVPIHRHETTAETVVCIEGCLDEIFCEEVPESNGETPMRFKEVARFNLCPKEKRYGIQIPPMIWHTIEVKEPSVIFEAKDGKYGEG